MGIRAKRVRLSVLAGTLGIALSGCLGSGSLVSGPGLEQGEAQIQRARIVGTVVNAQGEKVNGTVEVEGLAGVTATIKGGQFELELPNGAHELVVRPDDFAPTKHPVTVQGGGPQMVSVTLPSSAGGDRGEEVRRATLSGRVQYVSSATPSPLPLRSAKVALDGKALTYANGSFSVSGIAPGTHTIAVSATHFRTKQVKVTLDPGARETITLNMSTAYSAGDLDDLARLVRSEAGGEPYVGQVAVAASTLNRVLSPRYPNTIPGVVYQAWTDPNTGRKYVQYSPVINGSIWQPATPTSRAAVADALAGWDPSYGATGFFNGAKTDNQWVRQQGVTTVIGNHAFFK